MPGPDVTNVAEAIKRRDPEAARKEMAEMLEYNRRTAALPAQTK